MSAHTGEGKVALVTGGGSGIGRAACQRLASDGVAVVVADLNGYSAARTVALIETAGGRALAVTANIGDEADNQRMFDEAERAFGGVDMAFLNAGMLQPYIPLEEVTVEMFDRIISVNLRGTFLGVKQALTRLRPGGACVVTSSAAGLIGFAEAAAYSTSKHALIGLVRSSAAAFAARSLRINAICPGLVLTPMNGLEGTESIDDPDTLDYPEYRGGLSGQQVAEVAIFLMSKRAAGLNGQAQLVDAALLSSFPPLAG
jgi:NAD(P)-dependent dehydrogenase (short-subunit alcohol dehydrogenase family)